MPKRGHHSGNCYVASEALYHLLGGKDGDLKPMTMEIRGGTHWFLVHVPTGYIIDITAQQFEDPLDYNKAVGRGFLTKEPSKRAQALMNSILWQETGQ